MTLDDKTRTAAELKQYNVQQLDDIRARYSKHTASSGEQLTLTQYIVRYYIPQHAADFHRHYEKQRTNGQETYK